MEAISPREREMAFYESVVGEYLRYGSVDEVFKRHNWDLPISYPGFHKLLDSWGVVKSVGPNNSMGEAIAFLEMLSREKIPLERLYKSLPPSFQTSIATMYRILDCVKRGVARRYATCLVVTPFDDPDQILVAQDVSTPRFEFGKFYGALTLPMTFSKKNESYERSITRVLQQEVFSLDVVKKNFSYEKVHQGVELFCRFSLIDLSVSVYSVKLSREYSDLSGFSSFKLKDFNFMTSKNILEQKHLFRAGVAEVVSVYKDILEDVVEEFSYPINAISQLNQDLALAFF